MKRSCLIIAGMFLMLIAPGVVVADMVGTIMPSANVPYYAAIQKGLEAELARLGVAAEMMVLKPSPNEMAWRNSTRKLVTLEAKAIVAYGAGTALAAMSESHDLPIIFCGAFDPSGMGLAGKNISGVESKVSLKILVNHLKKLSNFTKLGVLFSSDEADSVRQADAVAGIGFDTLMSDVKGADGIALPPGVQAVLLTCAGAVQNQKVVEEIVEQAKAGKIATASVFGGSAELGILLSLSASAEQQAQETAKMVAAVLKGESPSRIAPVVGRKVELAINLAAAEALGLKVPFEIIATAKAIK